MQPRLASHSSICSLMLTATTPAFSASSMVACPTPEKWAEQINPHFPSLRATLTCGHGPRYKAENSAYVALIARGRKMGKALAGLFG